jgi:hypothetical protein
VEGIRNEAAVKLDSDNVTISQNLADKLFLLPADMNILKALK